jgi:hypothetical protein
MHTKRYEPNLYQPNSLGQSLTTRSGLTTIKDLGNGGEDKSIYNDPESVRQTAMQMGANMLAYVFTQSN